LSDATSVIYVRDRTAPLILRTAPELESHTRDIVSLLLEERSGHGTIDAA
jgi:hypothetical protein